MILRYQTIIVCLVVGVTLTAAVLGGAVVPTARGSIADYVYSGSFGSQGVEGTQLKGGEFHPVTENIMGVGVDEETGDVYVADPRASRIQKFDSQGNFLLTWGFGVNTGSSAPEVCTVAPQCLEGIPGSGPGQMIYPSAIAVDNSGGPNDGDVYVAEITGGTFGPDFFGRNLVMRFGPGGNFEQAIDGADTPGGTFFSPNTNGPFLPRSGALAVDRRGFLWVAAATDQTTAIRHKNRVMKFSNKPANTYVGDSEFNIKESATELPKESLPPSSVAVNATGSQIFVSVGFKEDGVWRFASDGTFIDSMKAAPGWLATNQEQRELLVTDGMQVKRFNELGEQIGVPFGSGSLGSTHGLGVNEQTSAVYVADGGTEIDIYTPLLAPDVTTEEASDVGHVEAKLHGTVAPDSISKDAVVDCFFEYGLTISYGLTVPCEQSTPLTVATPVTADISGLTQEKTYHYRVVASSSEGTRKGQDMTFTPRAVLGTKTEAATEITPTTATLNGSFDPAGLNTRYYFEWGFAVNYPNKAPALPGIDVGSTPGKVTVSAPITGLKTGATYHYRVVAINSLGTSRGEDRVFEAGAPLDPVVSNALISDLTPSSAKLSAQVMPGYGNTVFLGEFGSGESLKSVTDMGFLDAADNDSHSVSVELTGLSPGTTYRARLVAMNFGGTGHSEQLIFTTPGEPRIFSAFASEVSATGALLGGRLSPNHSPTTYHFEYGISPLYGSTTPATQMTASDGLEHSIATSVTSLAPNTTYHFRLVAINTVGTSTGPDQVFTTGPITTVSPASTLPKKCKRGFARKRSKCVRKRKPATKRRAGKRARERMARNG